MLVDVAGGLRVGVPVELVDADIAVGAGMCANVDAATAVDVVVAIGVANAGSFRATSFPSPFAV